MEYGSFQAEEFGDLQRLVDGLFYDRHAIDRLDLIVQAEILDLAPDLMEIVAFPTAQFEVLAAKAAILAGSVTAAVLGMIYMSVICKHPAPKDE